MARDMRDGWWAKRASGNGSRKIVCVIGVCVLLIASMCAKTDSVHASIYPTVPVEAGRILPAVGVALNLYEAVIETDTSSDKNIVTTTIDFGEAYLAVSLRRGEWDGDTQGAWYRAQRESINVPATLGINAQGSTITGLHGFMGGVDAVCDRAETVCRACPYVSMGAKGGSDVCPKGITDPVRWYHLIFTTQGPDGVIVGDYFCDQSVRGLSDCDTIGTTTLTNLRLT